MDDEIQLCPFCHSVNDVHVKVVDVTPNAKPDFAVTCERCDCIGPWAFTKPIAIQLWNYAIPRTESTDRAATERVRRAVQRSRNRKARKAKKSKRKPA